MGHQTIRTTDNEGIYVRAAHANCGSSQRQGLGTLEPWIEPLSTALSDGTAAPVVHAAVPFADAPEAHRILAARENVGKVVLVP